VNVLRRALILWLPFGGLIFILVLGYGARAIYADFGMVPFLLACGGAITGLLGFAALVDTQALRDPPHRHSRSGPR
jgi:hypothetical protein